MIESVENAFQLALIAVCMTLSIIYAVREKARDGSLLVMFYGSYLLGDLYWLLYLLFYGHTPKIFYVSDLSWDAAYVFLHLMLQRLSSEEERKARYPLVWLLPVFTAAMCVFYMQWGSYISNVIAAVLMSLLLIHSVRGLAFIRKNPQAGNRKMLYIVTLVFCVIEYCAWTSSCFFEVDTLASPYIWFDILLTVNIAFFLPAFRKAVES